jgi:glycosyltransferase involved in cell wall biosynthesis
MATYNGAPYIDEQIRSILAGQVRPSRLVIRDDHSHDKTLELAQKLAATSPSGVEFDIRKNKTGLGAAKNFLSILNELPDDTDFVAFSDQDDIWEPWKLKRAIQLLSDEEIGDQPALYCSRQQLVDEQGHSIKLSPNYKRQPSFSNALVENIATGCTVLINRRALSIAQALSHPLPDIGFHDWWLNLIITGVGGKVIFDSEPSIKYRQHSTNVRGARVSLLAGLNTRIKRQMSGQLRDQIERNLKAASKVGDKFTPANRKKLESFQKARHSNFTQRLNYLRSTSIYRQTRLDDLIMKILLLIRA